MTDLAEYARSFPSMGGTLNGPLLRELAAKVPDGMAIVELGTWLGAGTAQLALAVAARPNPPVIHSYDEFRVNANDLAWAEKRQLGLKLGEDTRPRVAASLQPFGGDVRLHAGNILEHGWSDGPIGLFVDDMTKVAMPFHHALRTFGPSWVPGVTSIVLMDYFYWKKVEASRRDALMVQTKFIEAHSDYFEPIEHDYSPIPSTRAFLYTRKFDFDRLPPFRVRRTIASRLPAGLRRQLRRVLGSARG